MVEKLRERTNGEAAKYDRAAATGSLSHGPAGARPID